MILRFNQFNESNKIGSPLLSLQDNVDHQLIDLIKREVRPGSKILEISCGNASDSLYLKELDFQMTCTEYNSEYVKNAKDLGLDCLFHDTKNKFPFDDKEFDLVYSRLGLHYFTPQELESIFDEINRISKKMIITVKVVDDIKTGKVILTPDVWKEIISKYFQIKKFEIKQGLLYGSQSGWIEILAESIESKFEKIDIERFEISPCIQVMEHELEAWKEFKEREKMSDKELEEIDLIFKEFEVVSSEATSSYKYESKEKHMTPTRYVPLINISGNIRKYTDDYYVVTLREEIFRKRLLQHDTKIEFHLCDQMEGLKAFRDYLKNKIKYLKKNLSLNESYSLPIPKKIPTSVGYSLETSSHAEFTSSQVSQIKELMRDATYRIKNSTLPLEMLVRSIKWSRESTISETPSSVIEIYKGQKWGGGRNTIITIMAQEDEWFTIRRTVDDQYKDNIGHDEHWRADQFEEVIDWLKEELKRIKKTCNRTGKVYESKSNYPQELGHREALRKQKELKPTKFSDYQIDKINKLLSKELQSDEYSLEIEQGGGWWDPEKLSYKTSVSIKGKSIVVKAFEDEYFMITKYRESRNTDLWWLCDGFEEVESWLKERFS